MVSKWFKIETSYLKSNLKIKSSLKLCNFKTLKNNVKLTLRYLPKAYPHSCTK